MTPLPRAKDQTRPRHVDGIFLLDGLERLTGTVRRGDRFLDAETLAAVARRCDALSAAIKHRLDAQELGELIDEDDVSKPD